MGNGSSPAKSTKIPTKTSDTHSSINIEIIIPLIYTLMFIAPVDKVQNTAEVRKPVIIAGEGVSPVKPVVGMPTFGTTSFKNIVAQHAAAAAKK